MGFRKKEDKSRMILFDWMIPTKTSVSMVTPLIRENQKWSTFGEEERVKEMSV